MISGPYKDQVFIREAETWNQKEIRRVLNKQSSSKNRWSPFPGISVGAFSFLLVYSLFSGI
jgi:hypothetical protein